MFVNVDLTEVVYLFLTIVFLGVAVAFFAIKNSRKK